MRCSRHNGRTGKYGAYNPKHNDREFDTENSEDIHSERTRFNVYWNCVDREMVQHKDRDDNWHSFTEVEKDFYDLVYRDYLDGQNQRHIASRHKERCRTMDDLRTNSKTCPEETIYQIGNVNNGAVDYGVLLQITAEFFNIVSERYGEHVHFLNWALHVDESTPHIHERHVFDVINDYGERQPKQEQALKELGFELPYPDKKPGKFNNRKMSFDAECRKLFIEICKKHGLTIEEDPIYGGKRYKELQQFKIEKLNANYKELQEKFNNLDSVYTDVLAENSKLLEQNRKLEEKIENVDSLLKEVSDIAYDKACETLIGKITDKTFEESQSKFEDYKDWLMSSGRTAPRSQREYAVKQISCLQNVIKNAKNTIIAKVKAFFSTKKTKNEITEQIIEKVKPSVLSELQKIKEELALGSHKASPKSHNREECL